MVESRNRWSPGSAPTFRSRDIKTYNPKLDRDKLRGSLEALIANTAASKETAHEFLHETASYREFANMFPEANFDAARRLNPDPEYWRREEHFFEHFLDVVEDYKHKSRSSWPPIRYESWELPPIEILKKVIRDHPPPAFQPDASVSSLSRQRLPRQTHASSPGMRSATPPRPGADKTPPCTYVRK
jgi:hypothetical protein